MGRADGSRSAARPRRAGRRTATVHPDGRRRRRPTAAAAAPPLGTGRPWRPSVGRSRSDAPAARRPRPSRRPAGRTTSAGRPRRPPRPRGRARPRDRCGDARGAHDPHDAGAVGARRRRRSAGAWGRAARRPRGRAAPAPAGRARSASSRAAAGRRRVDLAAERAAVGQRRDRLAAGLAPRGVGLEVGRLDPRRAQGDGPVAGGQLERRARLGRRAPALHLAGRAPGLGQRLADRPAARRRRARRPGRRRARCRRRTRPARGPRRAPTRWAPRPSMAARGWRPRGPGPVPPPRGCRRRLEAAGPAGLDDGAPPGAAAQVGLQRPLDRGVGRRRRRPWPAAPRGAR